MVNSYILHVRQTRSRDELQCNGFKLRDRTHPGVTGIEEHGDGGDVEDREHHCGDLHTEQRRGDHELGGACHKPDHKPLL